ncbi:hypothetical protein MPTK1_5g24190 [Marchantia polymorpha subsp. ruderalis]|uniref:Uncharacterized protein n=2 Tax=Marchantia polymorpha TaxID=3197 RepID=A0AAF6BLR0_MARPO|nr:hypothetical protein MARPO_0010s0037 [Marchantia polymorpha]BBN12944.1 hypothetical protein Mp_5g24190 [Marchantia polymorpha subsp. ruderalis]|eukprot:PTQ46626.1 hypothetical protein MARPO_0010s0037 [Marchantia polymorpha]
MNWRTHVVRVISHSMSGGQESNMATSRVAPYLYDALLYSTRSNIKHHFLLEPHRIPLLHIVQKPVAQNFNICWNG